MNRFTKTFGVLLFAVISTLNSQNLIQSSSLSIRNSQIKESANFGLVFNGGGLSYGINRIWLNEKSMLTYENDFGVDVLFSHGIAALGLD